jgi:hypothetical protein
MKILLLLCFNRKIEAQMVPLDNWTTDFHEEEVEYIVMIRNDQQFLFLQFWASFW